MSRMFFEKGRFMGNQKPFLTDIKELRKGITSRSHSEYVEGDSLMDMIKEDLVAERIAIDSYAEMIRYIGEKDSTTRRLLEGILGNEEEHADDLAKILSTLDPCLAGRQATKK